MKFNPLTNELLSSAGRLIKRLECPYRVDWKTLAPAEAQHTRQCSHCKHSIIDVVAHGEVDILKLMAADPATCLAVNINHPDIELIYE